MTRPQLTLILAAVGVGLVAVAAVVCSGAGEWLLKRIFNQVA